jgi:hypothetical protein
MKLVKRDQKQTNLTYEHTITHEVAVHTRNITEEIVEPKLPEK